MELPAVFREPHMMKDLHDSVALVSDDANMLGRRIMDYALTLSEHTETAGMMTHTY